MTLLEADTAVSNMAIRGAGQLADLMDLGPNLRGGPECNFAYGHVPTNIKKVENGPSSKTGAENR